MVFPHSKLLLESLRVNNEPLLTNSSSIPPEKLLYDRSNEDKDFKPPRHGGTLPSKTFLDKFKICRCGNMEPMFIGIWPCILFPDISTWNMLTLTCFGNCRGPLKELPCMRNCCNLVLFCNNQDGFCPPKLLCERSRYLKWVW